MTEILFSAGVDGDTDYFIIARKTIDDKSYYTLDVSFKMHIESDNIYDVINKSRGPTEIRTRVEGFRVLCASTTP